MPAPPKRLHRGLSSIAQAREERSHSKYKLTTAAGVTGALVLVLGTVTYLVMSQRELNEDRQDLLSKQRAVASTLGGEWFPLRDEIEKRTLAAAAEPYKGDFIDPEAKSWEFKSLPGIYLRLRVADSRDVDHIRALGADARRDAFASCFLREPNAAAARGEPDAGAFAEQPWNLGQAYAATRILTERWIGEVKEAPDKLRLRVFSQQYEKATRDEIPQAVRIVKQAQFFLLVLDEDVLSAATFADGGAITTEALQLVEHPARISLVNLKNGREMVRMRRSASASAVGGSESVMNDPEMRDAVQRQVNNCALAQRIDKEIHGAESGK